MYLRSFLSVFLLLLCWSVSASAVQNLLDTDSFGGTAATQLPTYDAKWSKAGTAEVNNCVIATPTGNVAGNGVCGDYSTGATWTNNQWAEVTVTTADLVPLVP